MPNETSQFEEIDIPAILLADIYSNSLVLIDPVENKQTNKPPAEQTALKTVPNFIENEKGLQAANSEKTVDQPSINKLGGFAKKILVLVKEEDALHISDTSLDLLSKMLAALHLSLADIALINLQDQQLHIQQIHQEFDAETNLFFGVEPSSIGLPMRFPYFQVQKWNNKTFMYSPSLHELNTVSEEQNNQKRSLWASLQAIFQK